MHGFFSDEPDEGPIRRPGSSVATGSSWSVNRLPAWGKVLLSSQNKQETTQTMHDASCAHMPRVPESEEGGTSSRVDFVSESSKPQASLDGIWTTPKGVDVHIAGCTVKFADGVQGQLSVTTIFDDAGGLAPVAKEVKASLSLKDKCCVAKLMENTLHWEDGEKWTRCSAQGDQEHETGSCAERLVVDTPTPLQIDAVPIDAAVDTGAGSSQEVYSSSLHTSSKESGSTDVAKAVQSVEIWQNDARKQTPEHWHSLPDQICNDKELSGLDLPAQSMLAIAPLAATASVPALQPQQAALPHGIEYWARIGEGEDSGPTWAEQLQKSFHAAQSSILGTWHAAQVESQAMIGSLSQRLTACRQFSHDEEGVQEVSFTAAESLEEKAFAGMQIEDALASVSEEADKPRQESENVAAVSKEESENAAAAVNIDVLITSADVASSAEAGAETVTRRLDDSKSVLEPSSVAKSSSAVAALGNFTNVSTTAAQADDQKSVLGPIPSGMPSAASTLSNLTKKNEKSRHPHDTKSVLTVKASGGMSSSAASALGSITKGKIAATGKNESAFVGGPSSSRSNTVEADEEPSELPAPKSLKRPMRPAARKQDCADAKSVLTQNVTGLNSSAAQTLGSLSLGKSGRIGKVGGS